MDNPLQNLDDEGYACSVKGCAFPGAIFSGYRVADQSKIFSLGKRSSGDHITIVAYA